MAASAWRRKATASGGRSRRSEPQKWCTTPLPRRRAMRASTCARQQRLPEVVVEDVELAQRPGERARLAGQVAREPEHPLAAHQVQVAVVAAHERPLVEHQQRALVAQRAQAGGDRARAAGDVDRRVQDAQRCRSATGADGAPGQHVGERGDHAVLLVRAERLVQRQREPAVGGVAGDAASPTRRSRAAAVGRDARHVVGADLRLDAVLAQPGDQAVARRAVGGAGDVRLVRVAVALAASVAARAPCRRAPPARRRSARRPRRGRRRSPPAARAAAARWRRGCRACR